MAEQSKEAATKTPAFDGDSTADVDNANVKAPDQGNVNHPIRAQAPSPLQSEEESYIRRPAPTYDDTKMPPHRPDPGTKESGQASK